MKVSNVNYFTTGHILEQRGVSSFIHQRIMGWFLVVIHFYDYRRVGIHVFFVCKDHTLVNECYRIANRYLVRWFVLN